jgi:uncharacterized membrane protein YbhN (UPF0104 family)
MGAPRNRGWKTVAKVAMSAALLWLAWYMVEGDLGGVYDALRNASLPLLGLTLLNDLSGRFLMAWQTSRSMKVYGARYPVSSMLAINLKTAFFSFFMPGDLGGAAIKWYFIARIEGKGPETLAAMIYVRIVNMLVLLVTGLGALAFKWPFESRSALAFILAALALGIVAILVIHLRLTEAAWARLLSSRWGGLPGTGVIRWLDKLHSALMTMGRIPLRQLLLLWSLSFAIKLSVTLTFWLAAHTLGLAPGFVVLLWIHSAVELVQFLPVSIAGLGVREITAIYLLGHFGVAEADALAFSLLLFALRIALVLLGGALAFWHAFHGEGRPGSESSPLQRV